MASLEFDSEVNAMYLRLRKGKVSSTEPLADNIMVDLEEESPRARASLAADPQEGDKGTAGLAGS